MNRKCKNLGIKSPKDNKTIGRFSALAVANVVYITSYYNGIANSYVMAKNGGGIDIDLVSSLETDEKNGVEIRVQVDSVYGYDGILNSLCYISNLYIECQGADNDSYHIGWNSLKSAVDRFNSRKIIDFGEFKHNTFITENYYYDTGKIVLGDIVYPISFKNIVPLEKYPRLSASDIANVLRDINVVFPIGSLDITPNREALLYSERTIKTLREAYTKVFDYLRDEYVKQAESNTNLIEYYNQVRQSRSIVLTKDDVTIKIDIPREVSNSEYKFKGKVVDKKILEKIDNIFYHSISQFPIAFILDDKGVLNSYRKNKLDIRNILYDKGYRNYRPNNIQIIKIGSKEATKSVLLRSYAASKYKVYTSNTYRIFIPNYTFKDAVNWFLTSEYAFKEFDSVISTYITNETKSIWLLKELIRALSSYTKEDSIENSEEFKTWKENRRLAAKVNTQVVSEKPILGYVEYDYCVRKLEFKTLSEFEYQLKMYTSLEEKERNLPVICGEMHSPYWNIYDKLVTHNSKKRFLIVKTAKNNMKYFKDISPKWIHIEDYIPKMKEFRQFLTYRKYRKDNPSPVSPVSDYNEEYKAAKNLLDSIVSYIVKEDKKAIKMCINYTLPNFRSEDCEALNTLLTKYKETSKVPYDYEFMYALSVYDKYMKLVSKVENSYYKFKKYFYSSPGIAFTYFLMKNKLLRMDFSQYKDLVQTFKIKVE